MKLLYPFDKTYPISQTYNQHVERAKKNNWCSTPGPCPSGIYYFGGIDYACPVGTPLYGTEGIVTEAHQQNGGYGLHVRIQHPDKTLTIYAHLSRVLVAVGDIIPSGKLIGYSGNTGNSTGPHLHFEHRINGKAEDPAKYLLPLSETLKLINPSAEPPVIFNVGDIIQLKKQYSYVNIRNAPNTLPTTRIMGQLEPKQKAMVFGVSGEWLNILDVTGIKLWLHSSYVEKAN